MGGFRLTPAVRARAGVMSGGVMVAAGACLGFGLAVGLVVAGVLLVAYCLLLMDVSQPDRDGGDSP